MELEEAIKNQKEKIECLERHIKNYEKNDCKTAIYQNLIEEKQSIETVLKALEELQEERQLVGMPVKNKRDGKIGIVLHKWKSGSVVVLENISPRVINTHDSWKTLEIITDEVEQIKTKQEQSISKKVIEDKIKELKQKAISYGITIDKDIIKEIDYKIEVLQDLLKGDRK